MKTKLSHILSVLIFFGLLALPGVARAALWWAEIAEGSALSALQGEKVVLSALAQGADSRASLTYQWFKGGVAITAASEAQRYWTVPAVGASDAGVYTVVVTSSMDGTATSTPLTLTVRTTAFPVDPGAVDPTDRESARQFYLNQYGISEQVPVSYIGDPLAGAAGDISPDHRRATLHRINWFRRHLGLSLLTQTNDVDDAAMQAGALIVAAKGNLPLTHTPTSSYPFYTALGANACAHALLDAYPRGGPGGVADFIQDMGPNNLGVGHRLGIFNRSEPISVGMVPLTDVAKSTVDLTAYGVLIGSVSNGSSSGFEWGTSRWYQSVGFRGWPNPGFCPQQLVFGRWSFNDGFFYAEPWGNLLFTAGTTTVTVLRNGVAMPARVINNSLTFTLDGSSEGVYDQYGQPAVTAEDVVYDVTISGYTATLLNNAWQQPYDATTGRGYTWSKTYPVTIKYRVIGYNPDQPTASTMKAPPVPFVPRLDTKPVWGQPATVKAEAFGATSYQWFRNGVAIPGATSATYSFTLTRGVTDGEYTATAFGPGGSTEGLVPTIVLPIDAAPTIKTQPAAQYVSAGQRAAFSVAVLGSDPITYQWYKGGVAITGATSATYTIASVTVADAGDYTVKATNPMGSVTSNTATLTVTAAPTITTQPASQTVQAGQSATFTVVAAGATSYQWYRNGVPVPGQTSATYRIASVTANNAATYTVTVFNNYGSTTSSGAVLTVGLVAPAITTQPADKAVQIGEKVDFTVTATGTSPAYQWYMNGAIATGHTSASFGAFNVDGYHTGYTFYCVVSNASGSVTSSTATLTVTQPTAPTITTQPADVAAEIGTTATFMVEATGVPAPTYQWLLNGTAVAGQTSATFTPFTVEGYHNGWTFSCVVTNASGSVTTRLATLRVGALVAPTISSQTTAAGRFVGQAATVTVNASNAIGYQWYKGGVKVPGATAATLGFSDMQPGDAGIYDCVLTGLGGDTLSAPVVVGIVPADGGRTAGSVTTRAEWLDIHHPNGATYDQFLLNGTAGTFTADPGQIARCSYLDPQGSIVQVEMSGAGAVTILLDPTTASGPKAPALYNQSGIEYMQGKATIILSGANETTHFTIYSVGTAINPGVTKPDANYAGWADVAVAGIISEDGKLGGIHQGNANYNASVGYTGIYAPAVASMASLAVIHDIAASGDAQPLLRFMGGGSVNVKIAGGSLAQANGDVLTVAGLATVQMGAGQDSCGRAAPAQAVATSLLDPAGNDVTASVVVP